MCSAPFVHWSFTHVSPMSSTRITPGGPGTPGDQRYRQGGGFSNCVDSARLMPTLRPRVLHEEPHWKRLCLRGKLGTSVSDIRVVRSDYVSTVNSAFHVVLAAVKNKSSKDILPKPARRQFGVKMSPCLAQLIFLPLRSAKTCPYLL